MEYSTLTRKINTFLRDNDLRLPTPDGMRASHNGMVFRYAKFEKTDLVEEFIDQLKQEWDGFLQLDVGQSGSLDYFVITTYVGSNP